MDPPLASPTPQPANKPHQPDGPPVARRALTDSNEESNESNEKPPDDEDDEPFFPEDRAVSGRVFTAIKTTGDGEYVAEPEPEPGLA